MKKALLFALCASPCVPAFASGQVTAARAGAGIGFETFTFKSPAAIGVESISLLTVPLAARVRVTNTLTVEALSAWASSRLVQADGTEATLSGPTDTEVRVLLGLAGGQFTVTGIAQLPTGSGSLTLDEADVAGLVAADVLPFRISNWGTGGGAGLAAAVTQPLGAFAAGLSVGYVVARQFEPIKNAFSYRPGNQLSVRAALDRTFGSAGKASLSVGLQHHNADQVDGTNLFQAGQRYEALGSYAFAVGGTAAGIVYAGYLHRSQGEYLNTTRVLPVEGLFFAGTGVEFRTGVVAVRPRTDLRVLRREDGTGQGYTVSAGAEAEWPVRQFLIVPSLRGRVGNALLRENAESGFTGFDVGVSVRFGGNSR